MSISDIEKSIIKKFRKEIWHPFVEAINNYKLINAGDKIAVCISGGKDSFLLAKCMQEIKKHGKIDFELEFIVMNPGYKKENIDKIKNNADKLGINIKIFDTDIFEISNKLNKEHPCYMCARMRRGYLYNYAKELGCNKIALGHHFDDVIETVLLSMFYSGEFKSMMPKLHSDNFEGMELIRPLYYVKENDIIAWSKYNKLEFINCACSFTSKAELDGKRKEIKELINELRKKSPYIDHNIFKCTENINLDTIIGYHKGKKQVNFLDNYDNFDSKNNKWYNDNISYRKKGYYGSHFIFGQNYYY